MEQSASIVFNEGNSVGWFKFDCKAEIVDGVTKLVFSLDGTDKDYYTLENEEVSISPVALYEPTTNEPSITVDTVTSTPTLTIGTLQCPSIGTTLKLYPKEFYPWNPTQLKRILSFGIRNTDQPLKPDMNLEK